MKIYADIVELYTDFAEYAAGSSPSFEQWARAVADDPELLAWIASLPGAKRQPNLVFAAARWHGVPAPGPYAGLRAALLDDDGAIRATIMARATQTNEVGRTATLLPAFASLAREGRSLALLEVGASAGLCLFPDRWGYAWTTAAGEVVVGPQPHLRCEVAGPAPLPAQLPDVAWRGGVDLNPLDVTDDDAMRWLETLVWPEHEDRRRLLAQAIEVARAEPPHLVRGDLLEDLPALVAEAAAYGEVVVFHSAVIAYLEEPDRRRFASTMLGLVSDGACRWVSNEAPNVLPEVAASAPEPPAGATPFLLGVDGRAVAWTHPHGRELTWFDGSDRDDRLN